MLWRYRVSGRSQVGEGVQHAGGQAVQSVAPRGEGAGGPCDGAQGEAPRACVGEAEARSHHVHGVIAVGTPAERAWAKAYVEALRQLAPRYGFGFVDGWHKIGRKFWPGEQAGAYLSSYFAGGRGRKMAITENVLAGDLPRLVVFVGRDLTSQTGCTMRSLRNARRLWASRDRLAEPPRLTLCEWLIAAAMLERRYRIE